MKGLESATFGEVLAELERILPGCIPLEFRAANTIVDAEGWLEWARRVVTAEGRGYALGVGRESVVEVYEVVKNKA